MTTSDTQPEGAPGGPDVEGDADRRTVSCDEAGADEPGHEGGGGEQAAEQGAGAPARTIILRLTELDYCAIRDGLDTLNPDGGAIEIVDRAARMVREAWAVAGQEDGITAAEREALQGMLQAHESGMDWLGLTNVALQTGQTLGDAAASLVKPVRLGYVERQGRHGAIYRLTDEGRRLCGVLRV